MCDYYGLTNTACKPNAYSCTVHVTLQTSMHAPPKQTLGKTRKYIMVDNQKEADI